MIDVIIEDRTQQTPIWIDVVSPTSEELKEISKIYSLQSHQIEDCMEPEHLPKYEKIGKTSFIIVRYFDETCSLESTSIQSMTRKLAVFIGDRFLVSIHRQQPNFLVPLLEEYKGKKDTVFLQQALFEVFASAVETYYKPLEAIELNIHAFEEAILKSQKSLTTWDVVFRTKCRLNVIKRLLWHTSDAIQKFVPYTEANLPAKQDLCERIDKLRFFADSLIEDLDSLLNIQMSLESHRSTEASQRTNDIMRTLTIFSAFFLPLNFIVGIYGMNFEFMPELKWKYGYATILLLLLSIAFGIFVWFWKSGWIRPMKHETKDFKT